jgi:hypothetical protein
VYQRSLPPPSPAIHASQGGLVFSLAKVQKLWSDNKFIFEHIEDTRMFQEPQPYHSKQLNEGNRFAVYLQAFRVIDKENFLQGAELLYLALDKKSNTGWDSVLPMFAAFLEGESSYYVGRSIKGGFWRYWKTPINQEQQEIRRVHLAMRSRHSSGHYASACGQEGSRTQVSSSLEGKSDRDSNCL